MMMHLGRTVIVLAAMTLASACGGGKGGSDTPSPNSAPVASFTLTPSSGPAPLSVQFDASASTDTDGAIASYSWNYGDGSAAGSRATTSHVYSAAGTFTVTLSVADNRGAVGTATGQVIVSSLLVPNVVGLSDVAARAAISAAGLAIGTVSSSTSDDVPAGEVISQDPASGVAVVDPGTAVNFVVSTGPSFATSPIRISMLKPTPGGFVPDQTAIEVGIESTFELSSVRADMAGRVTSLTVDASACALGSPCPFVGTLSLVGVPIGPHALTVRAADTRGNTAVFTATVVHDNPPTLTVLQPLNDSVALPTLPIDAQCGDDLPGCIVEVWVTQTLEYAMIASAPGALRVPVDLSGWMGENMPLVLRARDSAGQQTSVERHVFVENPARLTPVAEMPGRIVDADDTRLLFVETTAAGDRIAIHTRSTGLTEQIPSPDGWDLSRSARLTPTGAIFVAQPQDRTILDTRLYLWRSGSLPELRGHPNSAASLEVSASFAIWNEGSALYRLNTDTGTSVLVSNNAGNNGNSVAVDGTVVFWSTSYQILQDRAGEQTALTADSTRWHTLPITDGENVVYRQSDAIPPQQFAIRLIEDGAPVLLAEMREQAPEPATDYQIAAGWSAYTAVGNQAQLHVFTRSPLGVITRHTDLSTSSRIDRLGSNGEVMMLNGNQRFFSRGNGMVAISSSSGESYWLNGAWHVAIGRALLAVDTRDQ